MIDSRIAKNDSQDQYLPARMINEFAYCPRLFYFEHIEGIFVNNAFTVEGAVKHARVDKKADALPAYSKDDPAAAIHARSVTLHDDQHQVVAKMDIVECEGQRATPVDYKRGAPKRLADGTLGAWDPERIQLCVQGLVLRANGYECDEGVLFFWETRQRVRINFDSALLELTRRTIREARALMNSQLIPPPLVESPKCPGCSLVGICLPDETSHCSQRAVVRRGGLVQRELFDTGTPELPDSDERSVVRQLVTKRDEKRPLYLNTPRVRVGVSGDLLRVKEKDKVVQEIRINDLSQVNLMGAIQVSTQAVQRLMSQEIPLLYFSMGSWFYGMTQGVGLKNVLWRREQFRLADAEWFCLKIAKSLVAAKIKNQRTLLMRNHIEPPKRVVRFLKSMIRETERADSLETLLGIEGSAARAYFEEFAGMLKIPSRDSDPAHEASGLDGLPAFDFQKRNRRPPRDPINALLSLGYSLLAKDCTVACASVGLDPYLGFFHQPRFGRPSLALDLMEPFRPLIVDSAVLSAVNQRMVQPQNFQSAGEAVALTTAGRKAFFQAYEQRMDQLVTHPLFGYRVSYRRVLEIQVRLLARTLVGEIDAYPSFSTR